VTAGDVAVLKAWAVLCSQSYQTGGATASRSILYSSTTSKDDAFLEIASADTAKIAAMKRKWRERQNIPSVSRITIVSEKRLSGSTSSSTELTADEFIKLHVLQSKPALISGMQNLWGGGLSRDAFTVAGMVRAFGNKTVTVSVSQHGRFDGPEVGSLWGLGAGTDVLVRPPTTSMQLVDFFALFGEDSSSRSDVTFYLEYLALHQYLGADFMALIPLPEALQALTKRNLSESVQGKLAPLVTNLWIGGAPTISPLHYDDYENLLAQIRGHKELLLFPPSDMSNLYYVGRPKGTLKYEFPAKFERDASSVDKRGFVFGSRCVSCASLRRPLHVATLLMICSLLTLTVTSRSLSFLRHAASMWTRPTPKDTRSMPRPPLLE
jgi:hypothetical protein